MTFNMRKIVGVALLCFMFAGAFLWTYESRKFEIDPDSVEPHFNMSIKPTDISEETKRILNIIGQNVQLFDLKVDPNQVSVIRIWVEHFEHGEPKENVIDFGSGIMVRKTQEQSGNLYHGQLMFSIHQMKDEQNEERRFSITTAFMDQGGSSSTTADVHLPLHMGSQVTWKNDVEKELHLNKPLTLSSIIENDGHTVSHSSSAVRQYDATGEWPEELGRHDRVFLIRMMLQGDE
jgi:hypothetical protein